MYQNGAAREVEYSFEATGDTVALTGAQYADDRTVVGVAAMALFVVALAGVATVNAFAGVAAFAVVVAFAFG